MLNSKVKLGTPHNDKEIIRQIRRRTNNLIRIDVNEGSGIIKLRKKWYFGLQIKMLSLLNSLFLH